MEACATAHHWARAIERLGHCVRLMPPRYVKAYVKNQKNEAADAGCIRAEGAAGHPEEWISLP
jgi:transposase